MGDRESLLLLVYFLYLFINKLTDWTERSERLRRSSTFMHVASPALKHHHVARTICVGRYTVRPKIFTPFDFYRARLTIRLIQKNLCKCKNNYEILKIYMMIKHVIAK
jgi:hypothetical protein